MSFFTKDHFTALVDFSNPIDVAGERFKWAFGKPLKWLIADDALQLPSIINAAHEAAKLGKWVVGAIKYEAASALNKDFSGLVHEQTWPLAWFAVFDEVKNYPAATAVHTALDWWGEEEIKADFFSNINEIKQRIEQGEFYQVNYTTRFFGELRFQEDLGFTALPALQIYSALQMAQPNGYAMYFDVGGEQFASVSPELFFDWQENGDILTRPMKGTASRGEDSQSDESLRKALTVCAKERAENVMIVDLLRNDLSKIAQSGSVKVPKLFQTEALPAVWQMTSDVTAVTRQGTTLADVFTALFPCGSVTGTPKRQSMRAIYELEKSPRGIYCGGMGVILPGGRAIFNVAIRTVAVSKNSVGCGIGSAVMWDSRPENEWHEWMTKKIFLNRASQPFDILDSFALKNGSILHMDAHMRRLARTCQHFSYYFDEGAVSRELKKVAARQPTGNWRLRLTINALGVVKVQSFALQEVNTPVVLQLAAKPLLNSHSEFVRFKTTHRVHYDKHSPKDSSIFDAILWNEKGEITECTRGNIAIKSEGKWYTPPLSCGLLDGIGREQGLANGLFVEKIIKKADLLQAEEVVFLNDTRGWLTAKI